MSRSIPALSFAKIPGHRVRRRVRYAQSGPGRASVRLGRLGTEHASLSLSDSRLGAKLSGLLHLVALVSFSATSGLVSTIVLFLGFWTGCLIGLIVYGTILGISWLADEPKSLAILAGMLTWARRYTKV
jgi:hypothetical protein